MQPFQTLGVVVGGGGGCIDPRPFLPSGLLGLFLRPIVSSGFLGKDWLPLFCDLQVRWSGGKLLVAGRHRGRENLIDILLMVLMKVWHFRRFSEGRFVTMGKASRKLLLSLSLGLEHLVSYIKGAGESQYVIGGFSKHKSPEVMTMTCLIAMGSRVADTALAMTMIDDRLPLVLPAIQQAIVDELSNIVATPALVWESLGELSGRPAAKLRSDTLMAAVTSAGYIHGQMRPAQRGVWSLLPGHRRANLQRLAAGDPPTDDVVLWKIFEMMRLGMSEDTALDGLQLLSRCSWFTTAEEQGHVAASSLMKLHREYGTATLQCRSMMIQARSMFAESKDERKLKALRGRLAKVKKHNVNYITGRQVFLRHLNYEVQK